MRQLRIVLWIAVAVGLASIAGAYFVVKNQALPPSPIGGAFAMTDNTGKPVTEKDFLGKATAYFFGFTHCPEVCPTSLFDMTQRLAALGPEADKLNVVFVTVDPERDTPAVMTEYLKMFDPRIRALTGTQEQTDAMVKAFRVYYKREPKDADGNYNVDHTASIFVMDATGRYVTLIDYHESEPNAVRKLKRAINS